MNPRQFLTLAIWALLAGCDLSSTTQAGTSSETQTSLQLLANRIANPHQTPLAARTAAVIRISQNAECCWYGAEFFDDLLFSRMADTSTALLYHDGTAFGASDSHDTAWGMLFSEIDWSSSRTSSTSGISEFRQQLGDASEMLTTYERNLSSGCRGDVNLSLCGVTNNDPNWTLTSTWLVWNGSQFLQEQTKSNDILVDGRWRIGNGLFSFDSGRHWKTPISEGGRQIGYLTSTNPEQLRFRNLLGATVTNLDGRAVPPIFEHSPSKLSMRADSVGLRIRTSHLDTTNHSVTVDGDWNILPRHVSALLPPPSLIVTQLYSDSSSTDTLPVSTLGENANFRWTIATRRRSGHWPLALRLLYSQADVPLVGTDRIHFLIRASAQVLLNQ